MNASIQFFKKPTKFLKPITKYMKNFAKKLQYFKKIYIRPKKQSKTYINSLKMVFIPKKICIGHVKLRTSTQNL